MLFNTGLYCTTLQKPIIFAPTKLPLPKTIKHFYMDIMAFLSGNGLFLLLAVVLIVVYFYNRKKR